MASVKENIMSARKGTGIFLILIGLFLFVSGCAGVSQNGATPAGQGKSWWESDSPDYNRKYSW